MFVKLSLADERESQDWFVFCSSPTYTEIPTSPNTKFQLRFIQILNKISEIFVDQINDYRFENHFGVEVIADNV